MSARNLEVLQGVRFASSSAREKHIDLLFLLFIFVPLLILPVQDLDHLGFALDLVVANVEDDGRGRALGGGGRGRLQG